MVGHLYARRRPRAISGFTIFYMGINLGSVVGAAGGQCATRGQSPAWCARLDGMGGPRRSRLAHRLRVGRGRHAPEPGHLHHPRQAVLRTGRDGGGPSLARGRVGRDGRARAIDILRFGQWFNMSTVTPVLAWLLCRPVVPWPESIRSVALWPTNMVNFAADLDRHRGADRPDLPERRRRGMWPTRRSSRRSSSSWPSSGWPSTRTR